jgi:hypothetical protein
MENASSISCRRCLFVLRKKPLTLGIHIACGAFNFRPFDQTREVLIAPIQGAGVLANAVCQAGRCHG